MRRHTVEKSYEYDADGRLIRETIMTTEEEESNYYGGWWQYPQITCLASEDIVPLEGKVTIGN